jgi:hypothetical protein
MKLELNKENLIKCGFEVESIDKILHWDNYGNCQLISDNEYLVVQSEKTIYIGIEAVRKNMLLNDTYFPIRFPELFIEFYNVHLKAFLNNRKELLGNLFNNDSEIEDFKTEQRKLFEAKIQYQKDFIHKMKSLRHDNRNKTILLYQRYISEIINKTPQQMELKKDEVNNDEPPKELHNNIFELKQNTFDDVKPKKVIEHFKILHENGYISKENFELFIKTRFENNKNLNEKVELLKENVKVQFKNIFYSYYATVVSQQYGKQTKYVNLLCDNFVGFNAKTISTNFSD